MIRSFYSWTRFVNQGGRSSGQVDQRWDTSYLKFCRGVYEFQFNLGLDEDDPEDSVSYQGVTYTPEDVDYDAPAALPFSRGSYPIILDVLDRTTSRQYNGENWGENYPVFLNLEMGSTAIALNPDAANYNDRLAASRHIARVKGDWEALRGKTALFAYPNQIHTFDTNDCTYEHMATAWVEQGMFPYVCVSCTTDSLDTTLANLEQTEQAWVGMLEAWASMGIVSTPTLLIFGNPAAASLSDGSVWRAYLAEAEKVCKRLNAGLFGWGDGGDTLSFQTSGIQDRIAEFNAVARRLAVQSLDTVDPTIGILADDMGRLPKRKLYENS